MIDWFFDWWVKKVNVAIRANISPYAVGDNEDSENKEMHCPKCSKHAKEVFRIGWNVTTGVRTFFYCNDCSVLFRYNEYGRKIKIIKL